MTTGILEYYLIFMHITFQKIDMDWILGYHRCLFWVMATQLSFQLPVNVSRRKVMITETHYPLLIRREIWLLDLAWPSAAIYKSFGEWTSGKNMFLFLSVSFCLYIKQFKIILLNWILEKVYNFIFTSAIYPSSSSFRILWIPQRLILNF